MPDRDALQRYGLQVDDLATVIESAIGGAPVTVTVEGRARFAVNLRYKEDFRSSAQAIRGVLVPLPSPAPAGSAGMGMNADAARGAPSRQASPGPARRALRASRGSRARR